MKKSFIIFSLASCLLSFGSFASFQPSTNLPKMKKIGDLKPSFYWVAVETNDGQAKNQSLRDMDGKVLAHVSLKYYNAIKLEGTGKLLDGRIINFAGRVKGEVRYLICPPDAPYGYCYDFAKLYPFKSLAVDPTVIPLGSKVYLPDAVGAVLPDGTVHDGFFTASDIGEAIKDQRIDVFTSYGDQSPVFEKVGVVHMKPLEVFLVTE